MQNFKHKLQRLLIIGCMILLASLLSTQEAQACKSGKCYYNGKSANDSAVCGCEKTDYQKTCWFGETTWCIGHNVTSSVSYGSTSTCTQPGTYYSYYECEYCESHLFPINTNYPATDHNQGDWYHSSSDTYHYADCTNSWHDTSVDGTKTKKWKEKHDKKGSYDYYEDTSKRKTKDATCTKTGYIKKYMVSDGKYCEDCTWENVPDPYWDNTILTALNHSMSDYVKVDNTYHIASCTRSGCTHTHKEKHTASDWINSGKGYKYKNCVGSTITCSSDYCDLDDTNGCGATEIQTQWYKLTLKLDYNGGTLSGASSSSRTVTYGNTTQLPTPTRTGYTFKGWGYSKNTYSVSYTGGQSVLAETINSALKDGNVSTTLYAQWEKTIRYNISYLSSSGTQTTDSFYVVFRNNATSATVSSYTNGNYYYTDSTSSVIFSGTKAISSFKDNSTVTKNGYSDWVERGIVKGNTTSYATTIGSTLSVSTSDSGTINYYASYQRKPTITYVDYATNTLKTRTLTGSVTIGGVTYDTAGMCYNGTVDRKPVFTFPTQNTMVYGEALSSGVVKNETWTSNGWSLDTTARNKIYTSGTNVSMGTYYVAQQSKMASYGDYTYYGNYAKDVTLVCDPNGGFIKQQILTYSRSANSTISYTRYANINSSTPTTTSKTFTLAKAQYLGENGLDKYTQGSWVYGSGQTNTDFYSKVVGTNKNDLSGEFTFTPLVSETVYASWTNQTAQTKYEPEVTVSKKAEWNNPNSDDSSVDFDADGDIDIDGIVKVTLTVKVDNKSGSGLVNFSVLDYFDTEIWEYASTYGYTCSKGSLDGLYGSNAGNLKWEIASGNANKITSDATYTCTYYLKLKEKYWTETPDGEMVTDETTYYINPIEDLTKYKATIKSDGTLNYSSDYYSTNEGRKAYTYALYTIVHDGGTKLDGTQRYVPYSTSNSFVLMDHVHWKPTVNQVIISSSKNNIYKDISALYSNTYFVQYDTRSSDSSNSLFNVTINSSIMRSYSYYQITNNLFDIKTASKLEQVLNNSIGINASSSAISKNTTSSDLDKINGFKTGTLLNLSSAKNLHTAVNTGGLQYIYGALTSQNTMYATNQDGLKLSIYPFTRTTCTDDNKVFETTRDTTELANKRLDIIIDASNPIITPDSRIKTESESGQQWTVSDGYVDINLVDNRTNPEATTHTLAFTFEDKISGVNDPRATSDWITAIKDNVQVTLVNKDSGKTVFDYNTSTYGSIVSVKYNTINNMNKTGSVSVTLDPNNEDLLGHLELTIKVIDNVGNWETKTYDIYSFCLTGNVNVVDTLPSADERNEAEIWNGEQGKIQISANGYVDRVSVDFEYTLVEASKKELTKRNNITGDEYKINGDYPYDDSNLTATKETVTYLANKYLKCKWGYVSSELGGMPLSLAELATTEYTLNNSILNAHLNDLIANYIANETGGYVQNVNGNNYAIYGTTLYTYPIYSGDEIKSYLDSYTLDGSVIMNETPYPVNVIINGSQYATINYTEKDNSYVASIEEQTVFTSNWVKVGNEYLRPLEHYFYMPTYAEVRNGENANDHYIVQLTAYKDSGTDFVHSVSIQLTMTNDNYGGSLKDLQTNIKDN